MSDGELKNKKFFSENKKTISGIVLFLVMGIFIFGNFVWAAFDPIATGANLLSTLIGWVISALGVALSIIITALIKIAGYNGFTTSDAVVNGWSIVLSLCNMFFILILIVIAFATILRVEGYDVKRMVPKLIIMAVLINFSKTFCALIIDAAQLIMNTFVSSFADVGAANLTQMLGLTDLLDFAKNNKTTDASAANLFGAYIFALVYMLVAGVVLVVLLATLVIRIVMIWIYVVLSPLAYLLATFPQGQKYVSQWWDDFTKNVIVGPVLAFFLWLSLISLGGGKSGSDIVGVKVFDSDPQGLTAAMTPDVFFKFIISIGMLMGGLIITQQVGGQIGKIAGSGMAKITAGGAFLRKQTLGRAGTATKGAALGAGAVALGGVKGTAGAVNRLMGAGIASRMKPENKLRATASAGVTSLAMAGLRASGRWLENVKEKITGDRVIQRARHEQFMKTQAGEKDAKIATQDQKWSYDNTRKVFINDKNEVLKDKFGREVRQMGAAEAAIHQSFGAAQSKSRVAIDKVKEEKVEKIIKEGGFKSLDSGQLQSVMSNKGRSDLERMAAAQVLSEDGKLRNKKDADLAKEISAGLRPVFDKIEDAIDKKQTNLNYDLTTTDSAKKNGEINRLKKRIDKDKIDLTKLPKEAIKDVDFMKVSKAHRGAEIWKDIESAHKKGGEDVRLAIEETMSKFGEEFNTASISETDPKKKRDLRSDAIRAMSTRASLSGDLEKSFVNPDTHVVDEDALKAFFRNGTAGEITKINANDFNDFVTAHAAESHDLFREQGIFSLGKLKSLYKKGDNNDLVVEIKRLMVSLNHPDREKIEEDRELSSL